jgi:hypothetical protein
MTEVQLSLDFACCACSGNVNVTLKCAGKGLAGGAHAVAAASVPCPECCAVNQILFEPCGTVRAVRPLRAWGLPEPSLN